MLTVSKCALATLVVTALVVAACDDDTAGSDGSAAGAAGGAGTGTTPGSAEAGTTASAYVVGSVVIDADGNRKTYVQGVPSLDSGPFHNTSALELGGNGVIMATADAVLVGLAEEPTWVRYGVDASGKLTETGRLSLLNYGVSAIDYGNTVVDAETAVSVLTGPKVAVVWNPKTMTIKGEVSIAGLTRAGYDLEVWTTTAHDGLVYVPGRWADWTGGKIYPGVSLTVIDPKTLTIKGTAEDDRCASGGRVIFGKDGYGYVMGDGRNYSSKMFANAAGTTAKDNCLLRLAPGTIAFEKDYYFAIPSLTGGLESISELDGPTPGSGIAFARMFYPSMLPADVKPVDFKFWSYAAHKMWRLELGNPPTAKEVQGIPFGALGFTPVSLDGLFYSGESPDKGATTDVYEVDPTTNVAKIRFKTDGYFYGLFKVQVQ